MDEAIRMHRRVYCLVAVMWASGVMAATEPLEKLAETDLLTVPVLTMFVLLLIVVHQTIHRWLVLSRQRLALQAARARLEAMREARKAREEQDDGSTGLALEIDEIEEREIDLTALDHDSRKLLDNIFLIAAVVGLWAIWGEILPAFAVFGEITLWTYTSTIGETAKQVPITLADLVYAVLVIAITLLAVRRFPAFLEIALLQRVRMEPATRYTTTTLIKYTIAAVGTAMAFSALGGSWSEIRWIFAALGVGIGFGLQKVASNYVSGFIILLDRSVRIGDLVTVDNKYGQVSQINTRYTLLRSLDGTESIVPNETLITQTGVNHSLSKPNVRVALPVQVSYDTDLEQAEALMLEAAHDQKRVIFDDPDNLPRVFLKEFADNGILLELAVWIRDPSEGQNNLRSDINWAIWRRFKAAGIDIPFPQRVIHLAPDATSVTANKP